MPAVAEHAKELGESDTAIALLRCAGSTARRMRSPSKLLAEQCSVSHSGHAERRRGRKPQTK